MPESRVINTSPDILLAKVGLLGLVPPITAKLVISKPVSGEILGASGDAAATRRLNRAGSQFVQRAVPELPVIASYEICGGDCAVLSWAVAHPGFVAVVDDRLAQAFVTSLGIRVVEMLRGCLPVGKARACF